MYTERAEPIVQMSASYFVGGEVGAGDEEDDQYRQAWNLPTRPHAAPTSPTSTNLASRLQPLSPPDYTRAAASSSTAAEQIVAAPAALPPASLPFGAPQFLFADDRRHYTPPPPPQQQPIISNATTTTSRRPLPAALPIASHDGAAAGAAGDSMRSLDSMLDDGGDGEEEVGHDENENEEEAFRTPDGSPAPSPKASRVVNDEATRAATTPPTPTAAAAAATAALNAQYGTPPRGGGGEATAASSLRARRSSDAAAAAAGPSGVVGGVGSGGGGGGRSSPSPHNIPLSAYERRGSAPGSLIGTPLRRGSVDPSTAAAAASANVAAAAAAAGAAGAVTAEDGYRPFGTSAGMSRAVRRGGISGCLLAIVQFFMAMRAVANLAGFVESYGDQARCLRHRACPPSVINV